MATLNQIDGFQFQFTTEELKQRLTSRMAVHAARVEFYKGKLLEMNSSAAKELEQLSFDDDEDNMPMGKMSASNTAQNVSYQYKNTLKFHAGKVASLKFMAAHLVPDSLYRLKRADLDILEIDTF